MKIFVEQQPPKDIIQLGNHEILQKDPSDNKLLAVFDMDETLMHTICYFDDPDIETHKTDKPYDVKLEIKYSETRSKYICINIRPYVIEALKALKQWYRIVIFTASVSPYADAILNHLDPNNEIFEARYYRDHCFTTKERIHVCSVLYPLTYKFRGFNSCRRVFCRGG